VESPDEAAQESERLGFPVMLKGMLHHSRRNGAQKNSTDIIQQLVVAEAWVL
jgi:hypothetical protein